MRSANCHFFLAVDPHLQHPILLVEMIPPLMPSMASLFHPVIRELNSSTELNSITELNELSKRELSIDLLHTR